MGLFDMVLIKDNHISIAGGIVNALKSVDIYLKQRNLNMEVEVFNIHAHLDLFGYEFCEGFSLGRVCMEIIWKN